MIEKTTAIEETSVVVAIPPTMPMMRMIGTISAGNALTLILNFSDQDKEGQRGQLYFLARLLMMIIKQSPRTAAGIKAQTGYLPIPRLTILTEHRKVELAHLMFHFSCRMLLVVVVAVVEAADHRFRAVSGVLLISLRLVWQ